MKNLFVMHTQYNLILSAGILSRYRDAHNTLVLFSEFSLTDEMLRAISRIFDKVIIVRDHYEPQKRMCDDIKEIRGCLKAVRGIMNERYDNIFMSQERTFDMILRRWVKRKNKKAVCQHVEEDVYYSVQNRYNAIDYVPKESVKTKIKKLIYAIVFLKYPYKFWETSYCYGMSSEYDAVNLLFPELARREISGKRLFQITKEELQTGVERLYSHIVFDYPESDKYAIFFFDLMNRYKNLELVRNVLEKQIELARKEGRCVLFKYHPRETNKFNNIKDGLEIPSILPAEKILFDFLGNDVVVVGNATTSCIAAAKFGFKVKSICKIDAPENTRMQKVMQDMGIICLE